MKCYRRELLVLVIVFISGHYSYSAYKSGMLNYNDSITDFHITVPEKIMPMPFPLEHGKQPGFSIRGIKGYNWTPEQYLEEIPILAKYKANFLMNCYLSMFSQRQKPLKKYGNFLDSIENTWRQPLTGEKKKQYEKIFQECRNHGINYCFSMHPQLFAENPLNPHSKDDFQLLLNHYLWAQQNGVKWFSVCLDDINEAEVSISAVDHARLINKLIEELKKRDTEAQMIFCPTYYWGTGTEEKERHYLETLGENLNKEIYIFWTGPEVVPKKISLEDAVLYKSVVKHRLILWENYPVNDNHPTMHLGPITGRDPKICNAVDGYMVNPLGVQNQINRLPLMTCLDYAYNPDAYLPERSIGQAILQVAPEPEQQLILAKLIETYPGELIFQKDNTNRGLVSLNPVRERFMKLKTAGCNSEIKTYIKGIDELSASLDNLYADLFKDAVATIRRDICWMKNNTDQFSITSPETLTKIRLLQPGPGNPRNSEGDFVKLTDGRIMFIYTHFTGGAGDDAQAYLAARFSDDGGKTWSDYDSVVLENEGKSNIMSVSLERLGDKSIALFYLRKNTDTDCRLYMRVSKDEGLSWSKPYLCFKDKPGYYVVNNDRVVKLTDGRLIVPAALHNTPKQNKFKSSADILTYYSDDDGRTWKRSKTVISNNNVVLQEPGIVELTDGRLMMFCRTTSGSQYISFSVDRGRTWSESVPSIINSPLSPASIERIPSTGHLLMVWNNNRPSPGSEGLRTPLNVAISKDEGLTWINIKTIENDPDGWYCYTAIEFMENDILLAYCAGNRKTGNGLETTQITRFPVKWLYEKTDCN